MEKNNTHRNRKRAAENMELVLESREFIFGS